LNIAGRMLAMLCGLTLTVAAAAAAGDDEPKLELLEYLGSWGGEDDEWHEFFDSVPSELAEDAEDMDTTDRSTERDSD